MKDGKRKITSISEVVGIKDDNIVMKEIFPNIFRKVIEFEDLEQCRYYFKVTSRTYSNEDYTIKIMNLP